jgi:hypothetical protein
VNSNAITATPTILAGTISASSNYAGFVSLSGLFVTIFLGPIFVSDQKNAVPI